MQDLLARIKKDPEAVLKDCRRNPLPPSAVRELSDYDDAPGVQYFLASYPDVPSRILDELSEKQLSQKTWISLADHIRTPRHVMMQIAQTAETPVRTVLANNREISPQVAARLAEDAAWEVRAALAANSSIPPRIQETLSQDDCPAVRAELLRQKHLEPDILERLAHDDDFFVRAAVVFGTRENERLLDWADSEDRTLQTLLLSRGKIPDSVLESLCFSPHRQIQEKAIAEKPLSPDECAGWAEHPSPEIRARVAAEKRAPAAVQLILSRDSDVAVKLALAGNPKVDDSAVTQLLEAPREPEVLVALAGNKNLSKNAVASLCRQNNPALQAVLATRSDLQNEHIEQMLDTAGDTAAYHLGSNNVVFREMPAASAQRWAENTLPTVRSFAAGAVELPREVMAELARDPAPAVRRQLAQNPVLPEQLANFLATDPDKETAQAAAARLQQIAQSANAERTQQQKQDEEKFWKRILKKFSGR